MARGMNHVYLVGVLARDPELRYTPSGVPVFEATVAGEEHLVGNDGVERKLPWYHRLNILGKPAEWQSERGLKAGDPVMVEGALDYSQWEAPEGGKRSQVRVKALRMESLGSKVEVVQDAGGGVRMSGGWNTVVVIGNLARDPELRYTAGGDAVLGITLGVSESWKDRSGNQQEKTHWIDITLWRDLAEQSQNLRKGDPVLIQGRLVNDSWQDKDGNKRNTTKVEATKVESLARGATSNNSAYAATSAAPQQAQGSSATRPEARAAAHAPQGNRSGGLDIEQGLEDLPQEEDLPF